MVTEVVTCPHCNATYPEGEPHACVPPRVDSGGSTVLWPVRLAGIMLWLLGCCAAYIWIDLKGGGYVDAIAEIAIAVFAIMCLGLGAWIVFRKWPERP
jgi:hypothetical protein